MTVTLKSKLQKSQKKKKKKKNVWYRDYHWNETLRNWKCIVFTEARYADSNPDIVEDTWFKANKNQSKSIFWELCERLRFIIQSNFKNTFLYSMKRIFIDRLKDLNIFSSFEIPYHQTMNQQGTLLKQGLF